MHTYIYAYINTYMHMHTYSYLYWANPHLERIYKRIVRDRLHHHDDIFCGQYDEQIKTEIC